MGAPSPQAQQWVQDTVHFAKEQGIDRIDLGKEILLSLADEFGYWKIIIMFLLATGATLGFTIWKVIGAVKRRGGG